MEKPSLPSQEALDQWKQDPVTKAFLGVLRQWQEALKSQWTKGRFQTNNPMECLQANAQAIGEYRQLARILEIDAEQIEETLTDEDE